MKLKVFRRLIIFLALYTIQGLVFGYVDGLSLIFQEKQHSFDGQSLLSIAKWPFIFKFLLAPFLDFYYSNKFGKRKTYIIPTCFLVGFSFIACSPFMDQIVEKNDILRSTEILFVIAVIVSIQDIAIDGFAPTKLTKSNTKFCTIMETVGKYLGNYMTGNFFIMLNGSTKLRQYFGYPINVPLITHQDLLFWVGAYMIAIGLVVLIFVKEKPNQPKEFNSIFEIYCLIPKMPSNPHIRKLLLLIGTSSIGKVVIEHLINLVCIQKGVPKEIIAEVNSVIIIVNLVISFSAGWLKMEGKYIHYYFKLLKIEFWARTLCFFLYCGLCWFGTGENFWIMFAINTMISSYSFELIIQCSMLNVVTDKKVFATFLTISYSYLNLVRLANKTFDLYLIEYISFEIFVLAGLIYSLFYNIYFAKYFCTLDNIPAEHFALQSNKTKNN